MTMEADLMTMTMEADLMTMTMEADVMTKIIEEDLMTMEADVMTMDDLMKKARKRIKLMSEKEIQLVLKESEKMRPRIKQMSDKEMLLVLNESREKRKGLITKYPPPKPDLPPLTPHQQDMLLEDLLSHPKDNYLQYDTCRDPAQTPAELSEEDDRAIQILCVLYRRMTEQYKFCTRVWRLREGRRYLVNLSVNRKIRLPALQGTSDQ